MPLAPITIIRSRRDEFRKKKYALTVEKKILEKKNTIEKNNPKVVNLKTVNRLKERIGMLAENVEAIDKKLVVDDKLF
jgi:hypothetical protein